MAPVPLATLVVVGYFFPKRHIKKQINDTATDKQGEDSLAINRMSMPV